MHGHMCTRTSLTDPKLQEAMLALGGHWYPDDSKPSPSQPILVFELLVAFCGWVGRVSVSTPLQLKCAFVVLALYFRLVSLVQSHCLFRFFVTPWATAPKDSLSRTKPQSLLKLMSIIGDAIQPFHPLSSPSSAFNLSQHQGLFSQESVLRISSSLGL